MVVVFDFEVVDWFGVCCCLVIVICGMLGDWLTIVECVCETGMCGEGGDCMLLIDEVVEDVVFVELCTFYDGGARFIVVSEECGVVDFGLFDVFVVIDLIDGLINVKCGLLYYVLLVVVVFG